MTQATRPALRARQNVRQDRRRRTAAKRQGGETQKAGQKTGLFVVLGGQIGRVYMSSRWVRSRRSWRSCASIDSVAIGRASRRLSEMGSPVSSQ